MSYESTAEPIKVGYLFDFRLPESYPATMREDLTLPFEMVFDKGLADGVIDRPVEIVFREVEGLPKGSVKAVIDTARRITGKSISARVDPRRPGDPSGQVYPACPAGSLAHHLPRRSRAMSVVAVLAIGGLGLTYWHLQSNITRIDVTSYKCDEKYREHLDGLVRKR